MAEKRIATQRTYGVDPRTGRDVLVALPGHPLPDWYVEPEVQKVAKGPIRTGDVPIDRVPKRKPARRSAKRKQT